MIQTGVLYVVATPIGNLGDITHRASIILQQVDLIVAEDTRHTQILLTHLGIQKKIIAYHSHNEHQKTASLIADLQQGKNLALVSDAGTPLISDPGFMLIRAAYEAGIKVIPLPGACALITALSVSGLPAVPFYFAGFLPPKKAGRCATLQSLCSLQATLIFYEAPHRLLDTWKDLIEVFGETRPAVLARELTKQFETILQGSLLTLYDQIFNDPHQQKGECVILVAATEEQNSSIEEERVLKILLESLPVKSAAALCAQITGKPRNHVYELALRITKN